MSVEVVFIFMAACALLAFTPGPSMALLLANTTSKGSSVGIATLLGNALGLGILVTIATLGMNSVMLFLAEWFDWVRWIGAVYLIWLGVNSIRGAMQPIDETHIPVLKSQSAYFRQGMFVALSNPKVLLFLGAFFPQFINQSGDVSSQLALLAILFMTVVTLCDMCIILVASRAVSLLSEKRKRIADGASGGLLILGGVWLAVARK